MIDYVTGSTGFLGTHLMKRLGFATPILHDHISKTKLEPFNRFFFLSTYGNMSDHVDVEKIVKANIIDLFRMLDQSVKHRFKSFVYISTSSVKLHVQTTYSRTKKAAEEILLAYKEMYHLPICIIRPMSITGVGEQEKHLIPTLIRSCMTGETMNFVKEPRHDYIDVEDVVEGIINLSENSTGGIFELGNGKSYSNQEVLEIVEKVTGKKANVNVVQSMRTYDNTDWVSKNFRSRSYGWLPKKTLEQSITEMVKAYGTRK